MNNINIKVEIPGLEELAKAVMALAGGKPGALASQTETQNTAAVPVQTQSASTTVPVQNPQPEGKSAVPTQQTANAVPVQTPVTGTTVPTTQVPATHTMDELAVAASQLVNMGKQQRLIEILNGFGVNSLVELPQEKYGAFAGCLKAEGAQF